MQTDYEIQFPSRDTQRTPPYTGYIEIEPLKCPEYGGREKPLWNESPTALRLPAINNTLEMLLMGYDFGNGIKGSKKTIYLPLDKDDNYDIGITHHENGLGKLKIYDREQDTSFNVPIGDLNLPLGSWRISH